MRQVARSGLNCASLALVWSVGCSATRAPSVNHPPEDEAAILREFAQSWTDAYQRGDASWYERNLADDAVAVLPSGAIRSKAESIAAIRNRKSAIELLETTDLNLMHIQGDMAVETGIEHLRARDVEGHPVDARYRYTVVFIRRGGRWLGLIDQSTQIR